MRCLVLASSIRTLGNFMPVLRRMQERGDVLQLVWLPAARATGEPPPESLGLEVVVRRGDAGFAQPRRTHALWGDLARAVGDLQPDVVLCDDMVHWPARAVADAAREHGGAPPVIAFQHGLHQAWNLMNRTFSADYFLSFGSRHVHNFDEEHWWRVLPTGLPKLDGLAGRPHVTGDHVLFMAQSASSPVVLTPLLDGLQQQLGVPVKVRPHPGHFAAYQALQDRFEILPVADDPIAQIERCILFVSTHSTALLEALALGKEAVLLPSFGLTDFGFYPGIAVDFTADKVLAALKKARAAPDDMRRFLDLTAGGLDGGATGRALAVVDVLARDRPGPDWCMRGTALRAFMRGRHPLCRLDALYFGGDGRPRREG